MELNTVTPTSAAKVEVAVVKAKSARTAKQVSGPRFYVSRYLGSGKWERGKQPFRSRDAASKQAERTAKAHGCRTLLVKERA